MERTRAVKIFFLLISLKSQSLFFMAKNSIIRQGIWSERKASNLTFIFSKPCTEKYGLIECYEFSVGSNKSSFYHIF